MLTIRQRSSTCVREGPDPQVRRGVQRFRHLTMNASLVLVASVLTACASAPAAGRPERAVAPVVSATPTATVAPQAATPAPVAAPVSGWVLVAQFKGSDDDKWTPVFTASNAKGPWRLTWLTRNFLQVEVADGTSGRTVRDVFGYRSNDGRPGPAVRIGQELINRGGSFALHISAIDYYQIDIEEFR